jgi:rare lipoprotein A (peptidoglycan hydrolase)
MRATSVLFVVGAALAGGASQADRASSTPPSVSVRVSGNDVPATNEQAQNYCARYGRAAQYRGVQDDAEGEVAYSTERRRRHPAARFRPARPGRRCAGGTAISDVIVRSRSLPRSQESITRNRRRHRREIVERGMKRQSLGILCSVTLSGVLILSSSAPAQQNITKLCNEGAAHAGKLQASDKEEKNAECRTTQVGLASWYGGDFQHRRTASGEPFNMNELTAAHPTLPLNSHVLVTNLATGRSVVVRINDRGPYIGRRIIDLSARAATDLGMKNNGLARVRIELANANETSSAGSSPTASETSVAGEWISGTTIN